MERRGVLELVQLAEHNGVNFFIKDNKLGIRSLSDVNLPDNLLSEIKSRRSEIVDYLTKRTRHPELPKIEKLSDRTCRIPLSYSQERIWAMDKSLGSVNYHVPVVLRITGDLDVVKLKQSVAAVVERQEILRTVYKEESGAPYQEVLPVSDFSIEEVDGSELTEKERLDAVRRWTSHPFDLSRDYTLRVRILKECVGSFLLVVVMHPIAADKWGVPMVVREIGSLYRAYQQGEQPGLPVLSLQYADYCLWQRAHLSGEILADKLSYWEERLKGISPLMLSTDYPRPSVQSRAGSRYAFSISRGLVPKLKALSRKKGATLFVGLLSVYKILLHRYTGQSDICVGLPIANTEREELKVRSLVGWFVNSLALRTTVKGTDSFEQILYKAKRVTLSAYEHQDAPFELLVDRIMHDCDQSRNPLFQTMFVLGGHEAIERQDLGDAVMEPVRILQETSNLDLMLSARETSDGLSVDIVYCTDLFKEDTIRRLSEHFEGIIRAVLADDQQPIGTLRYMSEEERIELLETFNDTAVAYPRDKTVVDLFSERVLKTPDHVAVVFEGEKLTYQELDKKSSQLAHYLLSRGVRKEDLVAICVERGIAMIAGILGVMKSGGAYVPIDPTYPRDRIAYILADTASSVVLSSSALHGVVGGYDGVATVYLDAHWEVLGGYPSTVPDVGLTPHNLAYVIYTSGSTGRPKGVMMEHKSLVNLLVWQGEDFGHMPRRSVLQFSSISFDMSFQETFSTVCFGGCLHLLSEEVRGNLESVSNYIADQKLTHVFLPFAVLETVCELLGKKKELLLKEVVTSGEQLELTSGIRGFVEDRSCRLINQYGPTESHVVTEFDVRDLSEFLPPIGRPVANTQLYVLGNHLQLQPRGIAGELYVGGVQVARGYLNRPDLTAEKFVENPFRAGERLYRTGDLARWLSDGNLEFLGRKDHQVKIRGYRIELGEIEHQLQDVAWIKQSVVLAKEDARKGKYLVAYVVLEKGHELDRAALRDHLKAQLPDYMVPRFYVPLSELPLTPNGKLDRKALPEPDGSALQRQEYVAPRTELERELVSIWQGVLGVDKIGVRDDFFALGGDSIKAIQLRSRIQKLGYDLRVKDLFKSPSLEKSAALSQPLRQVRRETGALSGVLSLLPIQQRFFQAGHNQVQHYNQSVLLSLSKSVKVQDLQEIAQVLSAHHDALRLRYQRDEGGKTSMLQRYGSRGVSLEIERVSSRQDIADLCNRYQTSLNIEQGPVARIVWMETPESDNRLFITVHHLCIDGISWRILLEDFSTLLSQGEKGAPLSLEPKQTSYRQWGAQLSTYATRAELLSERTYWAGVLSEVKNLPQDRDYRGLTPFKQVSYHTVMLNEEQTYDLLRGVHQAYGTEVDDLLLSALSLTLTEWLRGERVVIGLEGHGREDLFEDTDTSRTLGWFTSLYPVALQVIPGGGIGDQITATKENLRGIPHKGIGYGILRYLAADKSVRAAMESPFDSIVFNHLCDLEDSLSLSRGLLSQAMESTGNPIGLENTFEHKLCIDSRVVQGALRVSWSYDANRYDEKTIADLAARYKGHLSEVIAHCKGVEEPVKTVSDYGLPSSITQSELEAFKTEERHRSAIENMYPLSPLQEGLLFHSLYDASGQAYLVHFSCDFIGRVEGDAFKRAWKHLSHQHSILRTALYADRLSVPVQVVYREVDIPMVEIDYREVAPDRMESTLSNYLREAKRVELDLSKAPLFRIHLVYLPGGRVKFLMTNHHILWDGWSFENLISEFMRLYGCIVRERSSPELVSDRYVDLVRYVNKQSIAKGEAYWRECLSDLEEPSYVPYIKDVGQRNELMSNAEVRFAIPADLEERLTRYGQSHGLTVNTILQGTWGCLLSCYNDRDTVAFGATVSGRDLEVEDIESRVGLYINTLPVVVRVDPSSEVVDWLRALQSDHTAARADYSYMPLNRIQSTANFQGPLFDSLLVFENYPVEEALQGIDVGLQLSDIETTEGTNYVLKGLITY